MYIIARGNIFENLFIMSIHELAVFAFSSLSFTLFSNSSVEYSDAGQLSNVQKTSRSVLSGLKPRGVAEWFLTR